MLWLALHFPALPLEIFERGTANTVPLAVVERQRSRSLVIACNAAATAQGIRVGMPSAAAQALADDLITCPRAPDAERESLAGLATWAGRFTPNVSLAPPAGLLLEIGRCLRLHHGLDKLITQVRAGLADLGYAARHACAPAAHGAWLLACAGRGAVVREPAELAQGLASLPIALLDQAPAVLEGLALLGAHTLGACARLPRDGLARRFGRGLIEELDRAHGKLPEARTWFQPPDRFERQLELPAPVQAAEALLFAARRLLLELAGYLDRRQAGVQACELVCRHARGAATTLRLGFVKATNDAERMALLLRERLDRTRLPAPVHGIALEATHIQPLAASNSDLFQAPTGDGDGHLLLERLRNRLGNAAVFGVETTADHRPEHASRPCQDMCGKAAGNAHRPLWLLAAPRPCHQDEFALRHGPERIESGWWDGNDVARDYYVAQDRHGAWLWVYRDRASDTWFLHGIFA